MFESLHTIGEKKKFLLSPSEFLADLPIIKYRLINENQQQFINIYTSPILGKYPGENEQLPEVAQNSVLNTSLIEKEKQEWRLLRGE